MLKFDKSKTKSKYIFNSIHSDVCQTQIISMRWANYFVSFIDDFFRKCYKVYPIKSKIDVLSIFKSFKVLKDK
jgi:hypothetical protein